MSALVASTLLCRLFMATICFGVLAVWFGGALYWENYRVLRKGRPVSVVFCTVVLQVLWHGKLQQLLLDAGDFTILDMLWSRKESTVVTCSLFCFSFSSQMLAILWQLLGKEGRNHDPKRVYYSDVKDDNELHVLVGKITIVRIASKVGKKIMLTSPILHLRSIAYRLGMKCFIHRFLACIQRAVVFARILPSLVFNLCVTEKIRYRASKDPKVWLLFWQRI